MLFFQKCIFLFSFRIWSSMEWWDFIFKIKLLEILQQNVFGYLVLPPLKMWSRHWRRNPGLTCGCCHPPSTPSMKCMSAEVCAHTQGAGGVAPSWIESSWNTRLSRGPFSQSSPAFPRVLLFPEGLGNIWQAGRMFSCLWNVLTRSWYTHLWEVRMNVLI